VASRSGSFDDITSTGTGTRSFQSDDPALASLWGEDPFEFIVVNETFWMLNPLAEPPNWAGFDLLELGKATGGDPLGSVDADGYLSLIAGATTEVVDVREGSAGASTWVLLARADDLVPLVAAGGPAARLVELGAADNGLIVELRLEQDPDGFISSVSGSMNEWWANALSLMAEVDGTPGGDTMQLDLRLERFESALQPRPPCADPSAGVDSGLAVLVCDE
jgi:hypothetical protein